MLGLLVKWCSVRFVLVKLSMDILLGLSHSHCVKFHLQQIPLLFSSGLSDSWSAYVWVDLFMWCVFVFFPAGGVLLPSGVSGSHRGGGDAHQTGPGQGRAGEVPAVQRHLHRPQERKGKRHEQSLCRRSANFPQSPLKRTRFYTLHLTHFMISSLAVLFMSDQEVLFLHLVLHLPVLQKVSSLTTMRATHFKGLECKI